MQRRYTHIYGVVCIIKCIHTQACGEHDSGCDAFHICVSQSPTTKFACRAHRWTMCGQSAGNPPYSLHPQAPISIMKLHRIKQTSGRHDELSLGGVSLVLFARTYRWHRCWSVIFPRSEFPGYAREKGYSPRSPLHTPVSSECYNTTCMSRVPSSRRRRIVNSVSCSLYRRELCSKLRIVFSLMYCGYTIIPNSC